MCLFLSNICVQQHYTDNTRLGGTLSTKKLWKTTTFFILLELTGLAILSWAHEVVV